MGLVETTLGDGDRAGVVTVTLADEENRNALSAALVAALVEAFDDIARNMATLRKGRRVEIMKQAAAAPEKFDGDFGEVLNI